MSIKRIGDFCNVFKFCAHVCWNRRSPLLATLAKLVWSLSDPATTNAEWFKLVKWLITGPGMDTFQLNTLQIWSIFKLVNSDISIHKFFKDGIFNPFRTKTPKFLFPRGNKPLLYYQIGNINIFIFITNQLNLMFCVDKIKYEHLAILFNLKYCQFAPRMMIVNLCIYMLPIWGFADYFA